MAESEVVTIAARAVGTFVAATEAAGVDATPLLERTGVDRAVLDSAEARVTRKAAYTFMDAAVDATRDLNLGLRAAELGTAAYGGYGIVEFVAGSTPTIGGAIRAAKRYQRLLQDDLEIDLTQRDGEAKIGISMRDGLPVPRAWSEAIMASLCLLGRRFAAYEGGTAVGNLGISFPHSAPEDTSEHQQLFRAPLAFDAGELAMRLRADVLERGLVTAEPGLLDVLEPYANKLLSERPAGEELVERVRRLLADELTDGVTKDRIAHRMHMSTRTLCRRLSSEGTSFQNVLDDLRRELALRYLREPKLTVAEIADRLGFSSTSAFDHAFRRWTGLTPSQHVARFRRTPRAPPQR